MNENVRHGSPLECVLLITACAQARRQFAMTDERRQLGSQRASALRREFLESSLNFLINVSAVLSTLVRVYTGGESGKFHEIGSFIPDAQISRKKNHKTLTQGNTQRFARVDNDVRYVVCRLNTVVLRIATAYAYLEQETDYG